MGPRTDGVGARRHVEKFKAAVHRYPDADRPCHGRAVARVRAHDDEGAQERLAVLADHASAHRNGSDGPQRQLDTRHLAGRLEPDPAGVGRQDDAGVEGRNIVALARSVYGAFSDGIDGTDVVVTRWERGDVEGSLRVGQGRAERGEYALAVLKLRPKRFDLRKGDRSPFGVQDPSRDRAAPPQPEVDLLEHRTAPEVDRRGSLEQPELSAHVIGRRSPKIVGPRGQLAELVVARAVGEGDTLVGSFKSAQNDERALERQTAGRVRDEPTDRGGGNDVTRDRCGFDWELTRCR